MGGPHFPVPRDFSEGISSMINHGERTEICCTAGDQQRGSDRRGGKGKSAEFVERARTFTSTHNLRCSPRALYESLLARVLLSNDSHANPARIASRAVENVMPRTNTMTTATSIPANKMRRYLLPP